MKRNLLLIASAVLILSACKNAKKDFTQIKPDMDSTEVLKLVGEPGHKEFVSLFGNTLSIWAYKSDTTMITFKNGKVGRVLKAADMADVFSH